MVGTRHLMLDEQSKGNYYSGADRMKFEYEDEDPDTPWTRERRWWLLDKHGRALKLEWHSPFKNILGVILLNLRKIVGK